MASRARTWDYRERVGVDRDPPLLPLGTYVRIFFKKIGNIIRKESKLIVWLLLPAIGFFLVFHRDIAQTLAGPFLARTARPLENEKRSSLVLSPPNVPKISVQEASRAALLPSLRTLGMGSLALERSAPTIPLDEADNLRWSLIRRTPAAAEVYSPERGVDWAALREIEAEGEILVPAGFTWSFNETFQSGPGYKEASGILAGGHCALATVFNAAAQAAGLPTQYRRHRTPFPGYPLERSVNIFWGKDDLTARNTLANDLYFRWRLKRDGVTVEVVAVEGGAEPSLPSLIGATVAMTYGRPRSQRWGTLGQTFLVDHAIAAAFNFAARVDEWNGEKPVVVAVNPNIVMGGSQTLDELYIYHLIAEAERRQVYVMLDVQTGEQDPLTLFKGLMDKYLRANVWFDWDIEHTRGGRVQATQINEVAAEYFRRRAERGYRQPGIFAFYVYDLSAVQGIESLQRTYETGLVVPIFDGYGPEAIKLAKTEDFGRLFGDKPYGIMEFESRWGTRYDGLSAERYLAAYPEAFIFASQ